MAGMPLIESQWLKRRRLFRLQARLADDALGALALLPNEAREVVELRIRRLHGAIDEHAPAEIALLDDVRDLARESGDDRLGGAGGREQPEPRRGIALSVARLRQRRNIGEERGARLAHHDEPRDVA